jgi:pre-mRNA-processing factor SLU7
MRDGISEEELEAYKRNRSATDDPMAAFLGKDELVH